MTKQQIKELGLRKRPIVNFTNSANSRNEKHPMETTNVSTLLFQEASVLLKSDLVQSINMDSSGVLSGLVIGTGQQEISVQLTKQGYYISHEGLPKESLALVLAFLRNWSCEKERVVFVENAPAWMGDNYTLNVGIDGGDTNVSEHFAVANLTQLQAYWALLDLASKKKMLLPHELLVSHILKLYSKDRWVVQRSAMTSLLERIDSARREELKVSERPQEGILGYYRVARKSKRYTRPYEVVLHGTQNIHGSCNCKDFQKNGLNFCKHLAAVLNHWHTNDRRKRAFHKDPVTDYRGAIILRPELSLNDEPNPLKGIFYQPLNEQKALPSKLKGQLDEYFSLDKLTLEGLAPLWLKGGDKMRLPMLEQLKVLLKPWSKRILVSSAIMPALDFEIGRLKRERDCQSHRRSFQQTIRRLKFKLYPYQQEGVERALQSGRFMIADEMGLGKTVQGIAWGESLLASQSAKKVLVICPNALKFQWRREWQKVSGRTSDEHIQIVEGNAHDRQEIYKSSAPIKLMNYELLLRDLSAVAEWAPDAVILDEAQRIKNYMTKTAQSVKSLNPRFRLILTGTPMENRVQELCSLMDWIDDRVLGPSWRLTAQMKMDGDGKGRDTGAQGLKGLNTLRQRLSLRCLRRRRSEVLKQLPSRSDSPIYLPVTDEQMEVHDLYSSRVARLISILNTRPLRPEEHLQLMSYLNSMRIVSNGLAQHDYKEVWPALAAETFSENRLKSLFSPKLIEFRNLISGLLEQNVKVVVFSQWQRMLRLAHWAVADLLNSADTEAVFFTGAESSKRRTESIVRFHDDEKVRLFFASDAGSVGLNLQQAANICINLELPWNPAVLEQRNSRIYRLGQKNPVQIFNLITQGTIEERIQALVAQKQATFSALFDSNSDEVRFDKAGGFYQQVQNVITPVTPLIEEELDEDFCEDFDNHNEDMSTTMNFSHDANDAAVSALNEMEASEQAMPAYGTEEVAKKGSSSMNSMNGKAPQNLSLDNLWWAFQQLKVEKNDQGDIKIEAKGDSAKLIAEVFRGMASLFDA